MAEFSGKSIIITGASQGIGEACARYFAQRGANLILAARTQARVEALAQELSGSENRVLAMACDVSEYSAVEALVACGVREFGAVDVLVNNAGLIEPIVRLAESDPEQWAYIADVNYKGVYYGLRAAIPVMLQAGGGTIINISSGAAVSALEGWIHYCSTKAAVLSLTRCAHKEYADQGIRVMGLSPGTVATPMQDAIRASGVNPVSQLDPAVHKPVAWVAKAVGFLCTEAADEYAGGDFSIKDNVGRQKVGLPLMPE